MTTGPRPTNHSALPPRDDREALSALFDGELAPDAVRFAFKRMDHDAGWRDACGRWQLIGDVLRGQAATIAPASFANSVMQAVAAQPEAAPAGRAASASAPARGSARSRWPWMGGAAVAASVALVSLFVAGPDPQTSAPVPGTRVAAEAAPVPGPAQRVGDVGASSEATAPTLTPVPTPRSALARADSAAAAGAASSPRSRRAVPAGSVPTPVDPPSVDSGSLVADPMLAVASASPATAMEDPFRPAADEIATRPWPRAVLPGSGSQSLTVGFGAPATPSPSFYPFEPKLPAEAASQPAEPQR